MGEGYHNFHHQFPMDYRNAFLWYQYDPTKWFIAGCAKLGFASQLRVFPSNEISKGRLAMKLKELKCLQDALDWPVPVETLPVVSWATCMLVLHFPYVFFFWFHALTSLYSSRGIQIKTFNPLIRFHSRCFLIYGSTSRWKTSPYSKLGKRCHSVIFRWCLQAFERCP